MRTITDRKYSPPSYDATVRLWKYRRLTTGDFEYSQEVKFVNRKHCYVQFCLLAGNVVKKDLPTLLDEDLVNSK